MIKILPKHTQLVMKLSFPMSDCSCFFVACFLFSLFLSSSISSVAQVAVISRVSFIVSTIVPRNSSLVVAGTAFSSASVAPTSCKIALSS